MFVDKVVYTFMLFCVYVYVSISFSFLNNLRMLYTLCRFTPKCFSVYFQKIGIFSFITLV